MKYILVFFLIANPIFCLSQNLKNLDLKYGFNKFKLESSIQNYSKDLKYKMTDRKTGTVIYTYEKRDINIFGYNEIEKIELGFYKDRMYAISIELNPIYKDEMYNTIYSKLKDLFGYPTFSSRSSSENGESDFSSYTENNKQWKTENTLLGLSTIKCSSPLSPCRINIFMVSQTLQIEINNDGF
jgi:hypothetical protein